MFKKQPMRLVVFAAVAVMFASAGLARHQPTTEATPLAHTPLAHTPLAHIEKRGTGPLDVILIPGLACDWRVFESFMTRNAERYTMYAVTLPGFGGSNPPPPPPKDQYGLWLTNAVNAIRQFRQDHNLTKPVIIGHSMGGHLALRLAIEHPGEFRAVISIDGAPVAPLGGLEAGAMSDEDRMKAARDVAGLAQAFGPAEWQAHQRLLAGTMAKDPQTAEWLGAMFNSVPPGVSIQYMADFIAADLRPRLAQIRDPALVIASLATGDMMRGSEPSARAAWKSLLGDHASIKLVFFDHSRHFIQFDRPAELDVAISDFLTGREVKDVMTPEEEIQPAEPAPREQIEQTKPPATQPSAPESAALQ